MHPDIPPASIRIKSVKKHYLKGLDAKVEEIKAEDARIIKQKLDAEEKDPEYMHGLTTANVGSIYDVPLTKSVADDSTKAGSDEHSDAITYV